MNKEILEKTIYDLFNDGKGLLAMDESTGTIDKRFASAGIEQTITMRKKYRQLIVTTPNLNESIGGAILYDETIRQQSSDGLFFTDILKNAGIIPGIKVDMGAKPLPGFPAEKITEGLDGLPARLEEYKTLGARFAKWRAVISIGPGLPSWECIEANVQALCRYASICQEAGIVPIVEPEVLMDGDHNIERCYEVTEQVLKILFYQLYKARVYTGGLILKPNMVIAGDDCKIKNSVDEVARYTVKCLLETVPASVPAIAFLSGGQTPGSATMHLDAMHRMYKNKLPWTLSFSFARAIQQPALEMWKGDDSNVVAAQELLYSAAKKDRLAVKGSYNQ